MPRMWPPGRSTAPLAAVLFLLLAGCASDPRLLDVDPATGFAVYRSGRLSGRELARLCRDGVREMVVLSGTARQRECEMRQEVCPGLRIRYAERQDAEVPVSWGFLAAFDRWVEEARREGKKIAFRCRHGWHRTGRLAAWYRIRFQGEDPASAIHEMHRLGRFMWRHRDLDPQVRALAEELERRGPPEDAPGETSSFPEDVCASG